MKKVIYFKFGGEDIMQLADIPIPAVQEKDVLIKVKAVSVNPLDLKIRNGEMKLMAGSKFPRGIGIDFSGIVEEIGTAVKKYKKGDEVFGILDVFRGEALSEYIIASEKEIALKPPNITFGQAAAMPVVGSAALQIFDSLVTLKKGTEILINGASGGIGMFATQIAKFSGAIITTVVSHSALNTVKDWGADFVLNYQDEDVLKGNKQYDVVIDLSGKMPFSKAKQIMKPYSAYVHTSPGPKEIFNSFFINLFSRKKYKILLLKPSSGYLETLSLYAKQGIKIVVSKVYPLGLFKEAYTQVSKGKFVGKVLITIDAQD